MYAPYLGQVVQRKWNELSVDELSIRCVCVREQKQMQEVIDAMFERKVTFLFTYF